MWSLAIRAIHIAAVQIPRTAITLDRIQAEIYQFTFSKILEKSVKTLPIKLRFPMQFAQSTSVELWSAVSFSYAGDTENMDSRKYSSEITTRPGPEKLKMCQLTNPVQKWWGGWDFLEKLGRRRDVHFWEGGLTAKIGNWKFFERWQWWRRKNRW